VLVNTGKPALHAVSSAELHQAMKELERQTSQNLRRQLLVDDAAAADMAKVARAAASMAATAADIPQPVPGLKLDKSEQHVFLNLAAKLRDEANALKAEADRNDRAAVNASMNRLIATCNACHSSFRLIGFSIPTARSEKLSGGLCQGFRALSHASRRPTQVDFSSICRLVSRSGRRWSKPNVPDGGLLRLKDTRTGADCSKTRGARDSNQTTLFEATVYQHFFRPLSTAVAPPNESGHKLQDSRAYAAASPKMPKPDNVRLPV
jgi:cytochrome c556